MLKPLYALIILLAYIASAALGLYAGWSGGLGVGVVLFAGGAGFTTLLALPLLIPVFMRHRAI